MEYKYLLEKTANKNITINDIMGDNNVCVLNILCYHVEDQCKYPFLQFMMEKVPYCDNIVKEHITIPCIFIRDPETIINNSVLERVKISLDLLGCDYNKVTDDMYKGILFDDNYLTAYALVNISGIDISGLNFMRQSTSWFVLPSEIINNKQVCNIDVSSEVIELFQSKPHIAFLTNNTNTYFMLPDVVYTGNEIKQLEFNSVFGNQKTQIYNSCGEYYYFYRSFGDAVKDGGWLRDQLSSNIGDRTLVEPGSKMYINGGVNRYALFVEGKIHLELKTEFSLTDEVIEKMYPEPCLIICYTNEQIVKPDILVKDLSSFVCLSYHKLNKLLLDKYYAEDRKNKYMIA